MLATELENTVAVSCAGVVKCYSTSSAPMQALRGVDLDVRTDEMTFLVGPSGSGKTTLISVMTGILRPDTGKVEVLGLKLSGLVPSSRVRFRRERIGVVLQQFYLLPALTAVENVAVALLAQGCASKAAQARSREILVELGLERQLARVPGQLSVGEQQRVAIARALVHGPSLVVCDEPTAALDAGSGRAAMLMLRRIAVKPGRAVVVVTHDDRILPFADRIAYLSDGRITHVEKLSRQGVA